MKQFEGLMGKIEIASLCFLPLAGLVFDNLKDLREILPPLLGHPPWFWLLE
jgi:hypothetical protein